MNSHSRARTLLNHAGILLLLGLQLFPVYMMLQISVKDNRSFLTNPWLPSWPGDWHLENWSVAVELITPYLLSTTVAHRMFLPITHCRPSFRPGWSFWHGCSDRWFMGVSL